MVKKVSQSLFDIPNIKESTDNQVKTGERKDKGKKNKIEPILDESVMALLEKMKEYIKKGILHKSDHFYNVFPDDFTIEETNDVNLSIYANDLRRKGQKLKDGTYYDLRYMISSERYQIQRCYISKGKNITKEDIYALDMVQVAKERFIDAMEHWGIEGAIKHYDIMKETRYWTYARSTDISELEEVQRLITTFATLKSGFDLNTKEFNFIRETQKKKTDDPACFDGSCLERNILNGKISIFSREVD